MTPDPDLATVVVRLETENRNLIRRLERLEQTRGMGLAALAGNVLLLVLAALLAGYLGFFPAQFVRQLPLRAQTVVTDEVVLQGRDGAAAAYLWTDRQGFHADDESGKSLIHAVGDPGKSPVPKR
jgi:hypothetical protein